MKNRLVDILIEREIIKDGNAYDHAESLAEYLLENGVIVPPCKVGDVVYHCCDALGGILPYSVEAFNISLIGKEHYYSWESLARDNEKDELLDDLYFDIDDIGKTVFLSLDEAEAAVKGADDGTRKAD